MSAHHFYTPMTTSTTDQMATRDYTHYHDHEALVTYINGTEVTLMPPEPRGMQWRVIKWRKRLIGQIDETEEERELELT